MADDNETITAAELDAALRRLHNSTSWITADEIFADAKANREPEWEVGDVVKSADGMVWEKVFRVGMWRKFGSVGFYNDGALQRPLKRMVEAE